MIRRLWHQVFKHPMPVQFYGGAAHCPGCGASATYARAAMGKGDVMRYRLTNDGDTDGYKVTLSR